MNVSPDAFIAPYSSSMDTSSLSELLFVVEFVLVVVVLLGAEDGSHGQPDG